MQAQPAEPQSFPTPPPQAPPTEFAPLSVRARGVLDILDLALRIYKRYFWVLLGWSALVAFFGTLSSLLYIFLWPLLSGAAVCCVAAAIRGQRVRFNQCWQFTNARYWPLVGVTFSALLIGILIFLLMILASVALFMGGASLLQNAPGEVTLVAAIIGSILWLLILTVGATGLIIWQGLVPIVVCMEEDKRDRTSLARAYHLLRGHWWRMITMLTIIGLAGLVLYTILLATMGSLTGLFNGFSRIGDLLSGRESPERFVEALGSYMGILLLPQIILGTLWNPVHHLILTLFYLDIRVRKEALDLEWTAYASASPTQPPQGESTPAAAPTPTYIAPVEVSTFAARPVTMPEPFTEAPVVEAPPPFPVQLASSSQSTPLSDEAVDQNQADNAMPRRPDNL